jgi:hypothetical protein
MPCVGQHYGNQQAQYIKHARGTAGQTSSQNGAESSFKTAMMARKPS